jgi:hypothetical protein
METRICQNCKNEFIIEEEDFDFYEKIQVPPPTWCPECRMIRRLCWRNERTLFRRPNAENGKNDLIISIFHPDEKVKTYDKEMWWSDKWNPCEYGRDYDFGRPFFEQFKELMEDIPHLTLSDSKSVNSRFCNITVELKNCYLVTSTWSAEDSMHSNRLSGCKFTHDSYICYNTEFGYENVYCRDSNRLFFSLESEACLNSYFLYDCRNCSDCILCTNLRNKNHCIRNVQYTRGEYEKIKKGLSLNTKEGIEKIKKESQALWLDAFHRSLKLINTVNVVGDNVMDSRNCYYVFDLAGEFQNVKYANWGTRGLNDAYDVGPGCGGKSELTYEGISVGVNNSRCMLGAIIWYSRDILYSFMLNNCSNCFGCVEMNGKKYCILNKQYTKEEYEKLLPEIKKQMEEIPYVDKKGRVYKYGEFFPPEISPFAYNETVAQDYFPITKEEAEKKAYKWREYSPGQYKITIQGKDLPQTISEVNDSILDETIGCEITGRPFKIIEQELNFYRILNLPIPSIHPDERHNRRLKLRNPMRLTKRNCYLCGKEINTTYLSEPKGGPKKVLCEECYKKEIY